MMAKTKGFKIQQRVTHNSGAIGTVVAVFNGGGDHGCYMFQSDNGARYTVHGLELMPEGKPIVKVSDCPAGGRVVVRI
jgi:hypothetical protein